MHEQPDRSKIKSYVAHRGCRGILSRMSVADDRDRGDSEMQHTLALGQDLQLSAPAVGESAKSCTSARHLSWGLASAGKGDAADPAVVA